MIKLITISNMKLLGICIISGLVFTYLIYRSHGYKLYTSVIIFFAFTVPLLIINYFFSGKKRHKK
jgi:hypothetical protein